LQDLEQAFCPPLDPALFSAIASDYDLADPSSLQQLEDTLNALKATADEQQDLPFDPSGTGGLSAADFLDNDGSASRIDTMGSRETDITSLRSDLSSLLIDGDDRNSATTNKAYIVGSNGLPYLTGMTAEEKAGYFCEMFPSVAEYTIKHTLTKCDFDVDRSMDVLLNLAFFDSQDSQSPIDEGVKISIPKGIEGFVSPQGPKKKGKNKRAKAKGPAGFHLSETYEQSSSPVRNKWDDAKDDLDFINSRTAPVLKKKTVASAYHQNHASRSETIKYLATANAPESASEDATVVAQVAELVQEFPTISIPILEGLLNITGHSVSAASELARATLFQPSRRLSDIIRIAAPAPVLDEEDATPRKGGSTAAPRIVSEYTSVQNTANAHFSAGSTAFVKASAAYRRGKSDRLMGGAAAYYASVGREHLEKAKRENSAAADALVSSQSSADSLDLHGVSVQDGVRIASDRVAHWWESLGDSKYALGVAMRGSYRIITGAGRHSRDGTSRLGPAVGKMLAREGWKFEVGQGVLVVTGRSRR
jgi:hypothetical protein